MALQFSRQRSGITGRRSALPGLSRAFFNRGNVSQDTTPIQPVTPEPTASLAPTDPIDSVKKRGDYGEFDIPSRQTTGLKSAYNEFSDIPKSTLASFGLGLASTIASGNPLPLIMTMGREAFDNVTGRRIKPFLKKKFVDPVMGLVKGKETGDIPDMGKTSTIPTPGMPEGQIDYGKAMDREGGRALGPQEALRDESYSVPKTPSGDFDISYGEGDENLQHDVSFDDEDDSGWF